MSADWTQTRNFYGLSVEEKFHQPCTAWHKSGFYIFAAAAAGTICVFHVGTTKVCNSYNCWASPYHGYNKYLPSKGYGHCITPSAMFGLMFSKSASAQMIFRRSCLLQVEAHLKAHLKNARALDYNPATNTLATCSFDKTVKVFT